MAYDECRKKQVEQIMKEFKQKKLRLRNNTLVKDKKQAIAIALNMALHDCILKGTDVSDIHRRIERFLKEDHRKIAENKIPLTNVIETRLLIMYYIKRKNKPMAHKLYMLLVKRITMAAIHKIKVDKHIWDELNIIQKAL